MASFLGTFLAVMEQLHAPSEIALATLEQNFDPWRAPEDWLPFLASFLDLDRFLKSDENQTWSFPGGTQRLRQLIMEAVTLNKERGTDPGLRRFLSIATGIDQIEITTAAERPYHLLITCPEVQVAGMSRGEFRVWLEELVKAEKPAFVTCEITIGSQTEELRA